MAHLIWAVWVDINILLVVLLFTSNLEISNPVSEKERDFSFFNMYFSFGMDTN
jgi:hypothetical protein